MKNEIMCRFDEDGSLELYEPYATVECETKEDYDGLVELVELGKSVVRCKDCKHWDASSDLPGCVNEFNGLVCSRENDFCSYGERRSYND